MKWKLFEEKDKRFSVVMFVQPEDVDRVRPDLEQLGKLSHVQLVVQPCPYEGIEFLYRVAHQLFSHKTSMDKDLFWQAIYVKDTAPKEILTQVSKHHYQYLCGILEQDAAKVEKEGKVLKSLAEYYAS